MKGSRYNNGPDLAHFHFEGYDLKGDECKRGMLYIRKLWVFLLLVFVIFLLPCYSYDDCVGRIM